MDYTLRPQLLLSLSVTGRQVKNLLEWRQLVRDPGGPERQLRADEFLPAGSVTGVVPGTDVGYSVPIFSPPRDVVMTGGLYVNGSREREHLGATVSVTKRMSNRYMLHAFASWGESEWKVPAEFAEFNWPNRSLGERDGDPYLAGSAASLGGLGFANGLYRGIRFMQTGWRANVRGLVQIAPERLWGFHLAGNLSAREGYPLPLWDGKQAPDGSYQTALVTEPADAFQMDDVVLLDLRVEKELDLLSSLAATFYVDAFNVFNDTEVTSREEHLGAGRALWARDTVSPRIYRLGVRLRWR